MSRKSDEIKGAGFNTHDRQIFESGHDEIVVWLYDKIATERAQQWLARDYLTNTKFYTSEVVPGETDYYGDPKHERVLAPTVCLAAAIVKIEHPLIGRGYKTDFVKGFIDVHCRTDVLAVDRSGELQKVGEFEAFIEVKTSVNVGETLRQMAFYKTTLEMGQTHHMDAVVWALCAPPFPHRKIIEDHGIRFIPYKPG